MLEQASYNATCALLAFHERTGLDRHHALLSKVEHGTASLDDIEQLRLHILSEKFTAEDQMRLVMDWYQSQHASNLSVDRPLFACGCCGMRDLQSAYALINVRNETDQLYEALAMEHQQEHPMDKALKRANCTPLVDATCSALELSALERDTYLACSPGKRHLMSVFVMEQDDDEARYFWLQPELVQRQVEVAADDESVSNDFDKKQPCVRVCEACLPALAQHKRPKWSAAPLTDIFEQRIEFGQWARIAAAYPECTPLTLVEKYLIARARLYGSVVQLTAQAAVVNAYDTRRRKITGHIVSFLHDGAAALTEAAKHLEHNVDVFPRVKDVPRFIKVVFLGLDKARRDIAIGSL
jgi:hypothetical protein